jgi:hypothetical protein
VDRIVKPQEKTDQVIDTDAEPGNAGKKEAEAAESGAGETSEADAEPGNADKKEAQAGDVSEAQASKNPILRIFKRKKDVRSEEPESPAPQEPEQAQLDPQESTDAQSQAGDDSSPEEKTEEK